MTKQRLKEEYIRKDIRYCELRLEGCQQNFGLSFAHRHKRRWYKGKTNLWTFNQTVLACANCHEKIEYDKNLTKEVFERLREY